MKTFEIIDDDRELDRSLLELKSLLSSLVNGEIKENTEYSIMDLMKFCESLFRNQRKEELWDGSWAVASERLILTMDHDARWDFIFQPTHLVVALLTRVKLDYPEIASSIAGFEEALKRGMRYSALSNLSGPGHSAWEGVFATVAIFDQGRVPEFLAQNPDFCPELLVIMKTMLTNLRRAIAQGQTASGWGDDYLDEYEKVIHLYKPID